MPSDPLELELQAGVSLLTQELGTELGSARRTENALNHYVKSPP